MTFDLPTAPKIKNRGGKPLCSHILGILTSVLVSWKLCFLWFMGEVFVRMPTGGGKTLFLPPLAMSPIAIGLISPLVALIDQQVCVTRLPIIHHVSIIYLQNIIIRFSNSDK